MVVCLLAVACLCHADTLHAGSTAESLACMGQKQQNSICVHFSAWWRLPQGVVVCMLTNAWQHCQRSCLQGKAAAQRQPAAQFEGCWIM
jgi:hypothetical protein